MQQTPAIDTVPLDVAAWLDRFARAVRERDYGAAREQFAPGVLAFGTRTPSVRDRDALEAEQWRPTWEQTEGFAFGDASCVLDGNTCCVAATWSSLGIAATERFTRHGRATLLLVRSQDGLLAHHSHFSLAP